MTNSFIAKKIRAHFLQTRSVTNETQTENVFDYRAGLHEKQLYSSLVTWTSAIYSFGRKIHPWYKEVLRKEKKMKDVPPDKETNPADLACQKLHWHADNTEKKNVPPSYRHIVHHIKPCTGITSGTLCESVLFWRPQTLFNSITYIYFFFYTTSVVLQLLKLQVGSVSC